MLSYISNISLHPQVREFTTKGVITVPAVYYYGFIAAFMSGAACIVTNPWLRAFCVAGGVVYCIMTILAGVEDIMAGHDD